MAWETRKQDIAKEYIDCIALLVIIVGVLGYFLGKYFNKIRKKRANELTDDDYEYQINGDYN